jgi:Domain of unknown function (DUF4174)
MNAYAADAASPLEEYRWHNRVLLIFADQESDEQARQARALLAAATCELDERDMVIGWLFSPDSNRLGRAALAADSAEQLRKGFGIRTGQFAVLLVGKDGGLKARYDRMPALNELYALIDAMPMRRSELAAQSSPCETGRAHKAGSGPTLGVLRRAEIVP